MTTTPNPDDRQTLQTIYQQRLREHIAEREQVEHEVIAPYASTGRWVPKKSVYDKVLKHVQHLHAARANWDAEPRPIPHYIACAVCKDAGFVSQHGRAVSCPVCGEEARQRLLNERIMGRWPAHARADLLTLARAKFEVDYLDQFDELPGEARATIKKRLDLALTAARRFAERWPKGIILAYDGAYGAGKTHLLAKVYAVAIRAGKSAIYITGPDLERAMSQFQGDDAEELRRQALADLVEVEVLLLDEADRITQKDGNGWAERHLFDIVDSRQRANRSTILAGNALDRLPGAVMSRIKGVGSLLVDLSSVPDARPLLARGEETWQLAG